MRGGNADNKEAKRQAAKAAAKDKRGPMYHEPYHDNSAHGMWVTTNPYRPNKKAVLDFSPNDPELKHKWKYHDDTGGFRPSKRKEVK